MSAVTSTILVVEDDAIVRMLIVDVLEELEFSVLEAADAEEALAADLEQMPDEIDEGQRLVQTQLALICRQLGPLRTLAAHLIKETGEA